MHGQSELGEGNRWPIEGERIVVACVAFIAGDRVAWWGKNPAKEVRAIKSPRVF